MNRQAKQECMQCDRNRDFLRIVEKMIGAIVSEENIQQQIAEELSRIMNLERCVIFRVYQKTVAQTCEIIAGTPKNEHEIGFYDSLVEHPDLQEVCVKREIMHVKNPRENQFTRYFKFIIEQKNINEILYLPLIINPATKKVRGIIVLDALEDNYFSDDDIDFCSCIGQLISMTLNREEVLHQKWRDRLLNPTVGLGGFAQRISSKADQILTAVTEIRDASHKIEAMFSEDEGKSL
jgi:transcriptional regulator with GAF, ATPase, and Fis domain